MPAVTEPRFAISPAEPKFQLSSWNGVPVDAARTESDVVALADYAENMIQTNSALWPPAPVLQKLYASGGHAGKFPPEAQTVLTRKLGYYSDLQSLHSEDAITWSFFGTLAGSDAPARTAFLNWLLKSVGLLADAEACEIDLWRRIPHPDTQGMGGPEIDFLLHGDKIVVFGEAKWRSGEGSGQGVCGRKTQLQLRREFCETAGPAIFGCKRFVVLSVVRGPAVGADSGPGAGLEMRTVSWAQLAVCQEHPHAEEFRRYYEWKQRWSQ